MTSTGESVFPQALDNLPTFSFSDVGVEQTGELWNRLMSGVEAVEGSLGALPEGQQADVGARLLVNMQTGGRWGAIRTGTETGNPRQTGSGIAVSFGITYAAIPHVFAQFNQVGTAVDKDNQGVIVVVSDVTTTGCIIWAQRFNGNQVTSGAPGDGTYAWLAMPRETVGPDTFYRINA